MEMLSHSFKKSQPCLRLADIGCGAGSDAGCEGSAKGSGLMQSHKPTRFQKKIDSTSSHSDPAALGK